MYCSAWTYRSVLDLDSHLLYGMDTIAGKGINNGITCGNNQSGPYVQGKPITEAMGHGGP